jgi:hypothetical protein
MHVEHIEPGGGDLLDNLCLSCLNCNLSKAKAITAIDSKTGEKVTLFKPRIHVWSDHFTWIDGGLRLQGITPVGRAMIERLKINQDRAVEARHRWVQDGFHPP